MRRIHLLRVAAEPAAFSELLAAARALGLRVGWLELEIDGVAPARLAAALGAGGERAVAVGAGAVVAARALRGPVRLRELMRQQFLGCALVLVRGEAEAPTLEPDEEGGWRVRAADGGVRRFDTGALAAALRQPRPFLPFEPVT